MIDELNKRIIKVMVTNHHSKSSFAKAIDVSLPLITHITTGRNKPGIDLIQKVLIAFPSIDPDWLLLGKGDMHRKVRTLPDFTDIQTEIRFVQEQILANTSQLETLKQFHKILIDEVLHLQEADITLNNSRTDLQQLVSKLDQIKRDIISKVNIE